LETYLQWAIPEQKQRIMAKTLTILDELAEVILFFTDPVGT
jgi:hypothetical protein